MKYVCLIYFDTRKIFDQSPTANAVLAEGLPRPSPTDADFSRLKGSRRDWFDSPHSSVERSAFSTGFLRTALVRFLYWSLPKRK